MRAPAGLALVLVTALVAACGLLPELEPVPDGSLVTVETRGGECFNGPCGQTTAIERDGRVHIVAPKPFEIGVLPEDIRVGLVEAVRSADFKALAARPFTGECPTAFDGQEMVYTFGTAAGMVRLASCEVEIDQDAPLFRMVEAAMGAVATGG